MKMIDKEKFYAKTPDQLAQFARMCKYHLSDLIYIVRGFQSEEEEDDLKIPFKEYVAQHYEVIRDVLWKRLEDANATREEYNKRLEAIQKEHQPDKWEQRDSYDWKSEWGPFVKNDADWDGEYLLDLIIYKMEKMYLSLDLYSNEVREDLDKRLAVLKTTIDLGKKILTHDYDEESHNFSQKHTTHYVYIYDNEGKKGYTALKNDKLLAKVAQTDLSLDENEDGHFDLFGDKLADKWVKEHGYTRDQVHYAYGGEWDKKRNHKKWLKIMEKEGKQLQADRDEFFLLISRNYSSWWW